jgi:hypothetical protein
VPEAEVAEWKAALLGFVRKLAWKHRRPLVLKSPAHTARIRLLLDVFPGARFVHIRRDPYAVFRSSRHTTEKLFEYFTLQRPVFDVDSWTIRNYRAIHDAYFEDVGLIRRDRFHEVRFEDRLRHADHLANPTGQEVPEIVLENSHDGTAAYRLHAGIYRFVCSNGLLIATANFGTISVKHAGGKDFESRIVEATREIAEHTPAAFDTVELWKQIVLPRKDQLIMAAEAFALKPNESIKPSFLLIARREEDYTDEEGRRHLWRTLNVLQENTLQGGIQGVRPGGRRTRTRSIRSVAATISLNRGLWRIGEETARQIAELN